MGRPARAFSSSSAFSEAIRTTPCFSIASMAIMATEWGGYGIEVNCDEETNIAESKPFVPIEQKHDYLCSSCETLNRRPHRPAEGQTTSITVLPWTSLLLLCRSASETLTSRPIHQTSTVSARRHFNWNFPLFSVSRERSNIFLPKPRSNQGTAVDEISTDSTLDSSLVCFSNKLMNSRFPQPKLLKMQNPQRKYPFAVAILENVSWTSLVSVRTP